MENAQIEEFREYLIENEKADNTIAVYLCSLKKYFAIFSEVNKRNMIGFKQDYVE